MPFFFHERAITWARINEKNGVKSDGKETEFIEDTFEKRIIYMANWNILDAVKMYDLPYEWLFKFDKYMPDRDKIYGINPDYNLAIFKRAELGIKD